MDVIQDGSFEAGNPNSYWSQSTTAGDPITQWLGCGPNSGMWWAAFEHAGGNPDEFSVEQQVQLTAGGPATLEFMFAMYIPMTRLGVQEPETSGPSMFQVKIDDTVVHSQELDNQPGYGQILVDLTPYADGDTHTLSFLGIMYNCCAFCVDDVVLTVPEAIPAEERAALIALYNSTNGSGWSDSSGWLGPAGTECDWHGVTCNPARDHVVEITLNGNNLSGPIPPSLQDLLALRSLDLQFNQLTGTIPTELCSLPALQQLHIDLNHLSGEIPGEIGNLTTLTRVQLGQNDFSGPIPNEFGNLVNLFYASLYDAGLSGEVQASLANLVNLSDNGGLQLGRNRLFTDDPALTAFLDAKHYGGDWSSDQFPTVRFDWSPVVPDAGTSVQFSDSTTSYPFSWLWDFGDGSTSTAQNPNYTYVSGGTYTVNLTASNALGSGSTSATVTVADVLPTAAYSWSPSTPAVGEQVQFTDASSGHPSSWCWHFLISPWSPPPPCDSTDQNPTHVFDTVGEHDVQLEVSNSAGSDFLIQTVTVGSAPSAVFSWTPTVPGVDESVQFTDGSTGQPTSWLWEFGDSSTSTSQNPSHAFAATGQFEVSLTATNDAGSDTTSHTITVSDTPVAEFTWNPTVPGVSENVQFTDQSTGEPTSWSWDFGDGTTSPYSDTSHAFAAAGQYQVSLTVSNAAGSDTVSHTVTVSDEPTAEFTWTPTAPGRGEPVQFTDQSGGDPTSWNWDFGDGDSSTEQHPRHTYSEIGTFSVTLTVANAGGSDSVSHSLVVGSAPEAEFTWAPPEPEVGETVQFTDQSTGQPDSWLWDFGDGATSPYTDVSHVFSEAGIYDVTLTVANVVGSDSVTYPIAVGDAAAELDLSWFPESPQVGEPVTFELTTSSGSVSAVTWNFAAPGCAGSPQVGTCASTASGCNTWVHRFAETGAHRITVAASRAGASDAATQATITVSNGGSCDTGPRCGDLQCNDTEDGLTCPSDCPAECGDLVCEVGEDPYSCASDCQPVCGNGICEAGEDWVDCSDDCTRPEDFAGGGVESCSHCLLPAAVGTQPGMGGTLWKGEAMVSNLDPVSPLVFWSVFTPDPAAAKGESMTSDPETLEPGECLYFESFVEDVFDFSGGGNVQLMADLPMAVTTRIYNTSEEGTFGQLVDAFDSSSITSPGQLAILIGLQHDDDFRTNVFVQEVSGVGATFELGLFGSASAALGSVTRTVLPDQSARVNLGQIPGVTGMHEGYATVRVTDGGRVAVIASVVDNATGDAVTVKPIVMGRGGAAKDGEPSHALVPVVARAEGFAGTVWRTQLVVLNLGDTQDITLELHPASAASPVQRTFTVGPRGMIADPDVVRLMLGDVQAQGTLHVYSETPVAIDSRTRNLGSTGTYGDSLKGLRSGDLLQTGKTGSLELLESSSTFRTNIGFANLGAAEATVELTVYRIDGSQPVAAGSRAYIVPAMRTLQVNKAFEALGAASARPAKAAIRVLSGGPIYAYASKVDNATGDPTNIVAVPMR